jgi:hypothetical protein
MSVSNGLEVVWLASHNNLWHVKFGGAAPTAVQPMPLVELGAVIEGLKGIGSQYALHEYITHLQSLAVAPRGEI